MRQGNHGTPPCPGLLSLPSSLPKGPMFIYPGPLTFYVSSLPCPPANLQATQTSFLPPPPSKAPASSLLVGASSLTPTYNRNSNFSSRSARSPNPYQTQAGTPQSWVSRLELRLPLGALAALLGPWGAGGRRVYLRRDGALELFIKGTLEGICWVKDPSLKDREARPGPPVPEACNGPQRDVLILVTCRGPSLGVWLCQQLTGQSPAGIHQGQAPRSRSHPLQAGGQFLQSLCPQAAPQGLPLVWGRVVEGAGWPESITITQCGDMAVCLMEAHLWKGP